jgi:hypothetical protein
MSALLFRYIHDVCAAEQSASNELQLGCPQVLIFPLLMGTVVDTTTRCWGVVSVQGVSVE